MSGEELPEGWASESMGFLTEIERGITFPASAKRDGPSDDTVVCIRTSNVQTDLEWDDVLHVPQSYVKNDQKWLRHGDTVISTANSYELVGKVAFCIAPPSNSTFGGFLSVIRPVGWLPEFLFWQMRSSRVQQRMRQGAKRTVNIANLSLTTLKPVELRVAPINEQRRIVAKLDALQAHSRKARAALDRLPALLERFRQSVLAAAFRGDLTADWRANHPDVEPASVLLERIRAERKTRWIAAEAEKARDRARKRAEKKGQAWTAADDEKALTAGRKKAEKKYTPPEPVDAEKEGLPDLPEGWCWASASEVCFPLDSGTTPPRDHWSDEEHGVPFIPSYAARNERPTLA